MKRLLTSFLYAGYFEYPKWGIPFTKAQHEPLISYSTYQVIQDRLSERGVAPARKDINRDFPLRGFLICDACGHPLTACWARSRSGKKYPYYLCQYRGCSEKGKSIPRDKLELEFSERLKRLVPAQFTLELAERMFREAWEERSVSASTEMRTLNTKVRQLTRDIDNLLTRLVQTENEKVISAYETRISELEQQKALMEAEAARIATPERSFDEMFEHSMRFLANPYNIWKNGDLQTKTTVVRLVFSAPLVVNRKTGVQTGETTFPFRALGFLEGSDLKVVPPRRFERRTS